MLTSTISAASTKEASDRPLRPFDINIARVRLTQFVIDKANEAEGRVGFGWSPTANAPETYSQLRGAFGRAKLTGDSLPVSDQHCEATLFLTPKHNVMFRFWHDVSHVELGLSFVHSDELDLTLWHLSELEEVGIGRGSLAYRLFEADLVGALLVNSIAKRFPYDQLSFDIGCVQHGLMPGVAMELARLPEPEGASDE